MGNAIASVFKNKFISAVLAAMLLFAASAWAGPDQRLTTVHAVGSSSIRGEDMSASRKAAIADSLVSAVAKVLTEIAPPDTVAGHFQVLNERILSRTDQFILNYTMLTESIHAKQHRVMVQATISKKRLNDALKRSGIYVGKKAYPSVLVCIAEKVIRDGTYQYWWGGQELWSEGAATIAMTQAAEQKGLQTISPDANPSGQTYPRQLSVAEAVVLGRRMNADIVIVGEAFAEEASNTKGSAMQSFSGTIAVTAYRVRNSQKMGQVQQISYATAVDPMSGGKDALNKASLLAGEDLSTQILQAWFTKGSGSSKVEIQVEGLSGNIANFVKFRGALSAMSGVDSVQRKEMQQDTAVLLVDYQGNVRALAAALMRLSFDTFSLDIREPEGKTIRMQLVPR